MNSDNLPVLSRVFTRSVLKSFADGRKFDGNYNLAVDLFVTNPHHNTNADNFECLYDILKKYYRNEYYYKNTLLNKLLLGVHSINTTTALTELPIADSIADFVLINGKAVVYEIKTELDNLERLENQVENYYKAFDYVSIITHENNIDFLIKKYENTPVGICFLNKKGQISLVKKATEDNSNLSHEKIFHILRKDEYENIILRLYGFLPKVNHFEYYDSCKDLFCNIDLDVAYCEFIKELKKRNNVSSASFLELPHSLKSLSYFSELSPSQFNRLSHNLLLNY